MARPLLLAGSVFPLLLFGGIALISEVEPNWSGMYLCGAAPLLALAVSRWPRATLFAAGTNALFLTLYAWHAATAGLPLPDAADRILRESHGYQALAAHTAGLSQPVVADRYAFAAMLNFHVPDHEVAQWPGIARPSEYSRGLIAPIPELDALRRSGFWLLAHKFSPPEIAGFDHAAVQTLFDCRGKPLNVVEGAASYDKAGCDDPLHTWRLYLYRPSDR